MPIIEVTMQQQRLSYMRLIRWGN